MKQLIWIGTIWSIVFSVSLSAMSEPDEINVTVIETNASCENITPHAQFSYGTWFSLCPAKSKVEAMTFLLSHNFLKEIETLPECALPDSPDLKPGIRYSQVIPDGYELKESNLTSIEKIYYHAYPDEVYRYQYVGGNNIEKFTSLNNSDAYVSGVRVKGSIISGYCNFAPAGNCTQAEIKFQADIYDGVVEKRIYHRRYQRICHEPNTDFPHKATNEYIIDYWQGDDANRTLHCQEINGTVQERTISCRKEYRCVAQTQELPKVCPQTVGSYVSPRDGVFHEDIALPGVVFGLHYASNERNNTVAQGWMPSNYAYLKDDKLHLGSGSIFVVDTSVEENGLRVITHHGNVYLFDTNGRLQSIQDLYTKEHIWTFSYDTTGKLVTITDMYGEMTTIERDANGTVKAIVAPTGQRTLLNIDANGDLIEVQYEDTSSYTFVYEKHLMTEETEPNGNRFVHIYDSNGNIVKVIDAEQGEWDFTTAYNTANETHTITRAAGDVITYTNHFLENNDTTLRTVKQLPSGETVTYTHTIDDTYASTQMCGMKEERFYRKEDNGTLYLDPFTRKRVLEKTVTTTPSGLQKIMHFARAYRYDTQGNLTRRIDTQTVEGNTFTLIKDFKRKRDIFITPKGKRFHVQYDEKMQLPVHIKPYGSEKTLYSYDAHGRLVKEQTGNRTTRYSYDDRGNLQSVTDPLGRSTIYAYDAKDRLIQVTYPDGTTEHFAYDANGNLITRTVPTPADHTFAYNGVNKRTAYTSPLQKQTVYVYDTQRRTTKVIKLSGKSINIAYTNGRVMAVTTPEGTTDYTYACQSNISSITKPSVGSGADEKIDYAYDGTLLASITQSGVLNQSITYSYNSDFLPQSITYAGKTVAFAYNKDNELIQSGAFSLRRDKEGRRIFIEDAYLHRKFVFNHYGELKTVKDNALFVKLKRNKNGQIVKKREILGNKKRIYRYEYDEKGRLIRVYRGNGKRKRLVESYTYDANGNRASTTVYGVTTTGSYTLDDNLIVYGDNTYRYDEDGYLVEKTAPQGSTSYTYNTLGALTKVVLPNGTTIEYPQDALNRRVAKKVNGQMRLRRLRGQVTMTT